MVLKNFYDQQNQFLNMIYELTAYFFFKNKYRPSIYFTSLSNSSLFSREIK